uniref:Uncharacterized protein n=1 Tax=Triticum aestivum TaxID=4565 RepID=A0A077RSR0_WHEAT|nr:unnamed protein product [Triticum aestivum]
MAETPDSVLAVDIYCYKIRRLVDPPPPHLARCSNFHLLNVKNNSGLEGLIKMVDLIQTKCNQRGYGFNTDMSEGMILENVFSVWFRLNCSPTVPAQPPNVLCLRRAFFQLLYWFSLHTDIAGRLSKLENKGWRPRRTIISAVGMQKSLRWYVLARMLSDAFSSASVSSKALKNPMPRIGPTEWTEEDMDMLASRGVAYLNVDMSMFGPGSLMPPATPQLDELINEASRMVADPDDPYHTLYDYMAQMSDHESFI